MNNDKPTKEFLKSILPNVPNDVLEVVMEELKKNTIVLTEDKSDEPNILCPGTVQMVLGKKHIVGQPILSVEEAVVPEGFTGYVQVYPEGEEVRWYPFIKGVLSNFLIVMECEHCGKITSSKEEYIDDLSWNTPEPIIDNQFILKYKGHSKGNIPDDPYQCIAHLREVIKRLAKNK